MHQDRATSVDYHWMARAIQLAKKGQYTTSPNPRVGCVIVSDTNEMVGEGFHIQAGTPHAEVHALAMAGVRAKNATAYVTLEPCSHFGRTPPCADGLIAAGVKKVVVAMVDPNPQVAGQGIKKLTKAGIEVVSGVMEDLAKELNLGFINRMTTGRPYVRVKLATSIDGQVALANGQSQWITGAQARQDVQRYRAQSCAVVTGQGTVQADDPSLLVRPLDAKFTNYPLADIRQPLRVVIDGHNKLSLTQKMFHDGFPVWLVNNSERVDSVPSHVKQLTVPATSGHVCLSALLEELAKAGHNDVWVEAGGQLAGAFIAQGLVDELIVYQAPKLLGNKAQGMVALPDFMSLEDVPIFTLVDFRQIGQDIKLIYRPRNDLQ